MASRQMLAHDEESQTDGEVNSVARGLATPFWLVLTIAGCVAIAFTGLGYSSGETAVAWIRRDTQAQPTAARDVQQAEHDGVRALLQPDETEVALGIPAAAEVPSEPPAGTSPPHQADRTGWVARLRASARGNSAPSFGPDLLFATQGYTR